MGPTAIPSATATPRSTPLPALATPVPIGVEQNPVRMVLRPARSAAAAREAARELEAALVEEANLTIEVETAERSAEALAALCSSTTNEITVAWLDGASYMAALAQNCGTPALAVQRGTRNNASTGQSVQIITTRTLNIENVSGLDNRDFCRVSFDDFYSWFVPSLMLQANGIDPLTDLRSVNSYEDVTALVQAVGQGQCNATGIHPNVFDEVEILEASRDDIRVVAESVPFPYGILMFPIETPLGVRIALTDALIAVANDLSGAETLEALLEQDSLVRVEEDDFSEFVDFMDSTGLDFAQLGD